MIFKKLWAYVSQSGGNVPQATFSLNEFGMQTDNILRMVCTNFGTSKSITFY